MRCSTENVYKKKLWIKKGCYILNSASFVISSTTLLEFMFCIVNLCENSFSCYATLFLFIVVYSISYSNNIIYMSDLVVLLFCWSERQVKGLSRAELPGFEPNSDHNILSVHYFISIKQMYSSVSLRYFFCLLIHCELSF